MVQKIYTTLHKFRVYIEKKKTTKRHSKHMQVYRANNVQISSYNLEIKKMFVQQTPSTP